MNFKCCAQDAREIARKFTAADALHILRCGGTSDNLDQLTGNGSLSGTVVKNLESVDHVTSVLGSVVHGVAASRLLTGMTLGKSLYDVSKVVSQKMFQNKGGCLPSKGSWPASIRGGYRGLSRQPRRKRCWLEVVLVR